MLAYRGIEALSRQLSLRGVSHVVVIAGRQHSDTYGRERYQNLRVKLNSNNQAAPNWLTFLRKFGIKSVPVELSGVHAGAFKYQYSNPNNTICIWTTERPDQNTVKPGNAGASVLRVEDGSTFKFGKVRSALVRISNVPPAFRRMNKEETQQLAQQLTSQKTNSIDVTDLMEDHESAVDDLSGSKFGSLEDFSKAYKAKRKQP